MEDYSRKGWPMHLDMTKQECKQTLRALEISTYSHLISVFRAQGEFTKEKKKLLQEIQTMFSIPLERHRAEIRRAVNDETLATIADTLAGPNTQVEWSIEGRRLIPLMKRVPPQVAYTALATRMAQVYCGINAKIPKPSETAIYGKLDDVGADFDLTDSEEETEGLRFITEAMVPRHINPLHGSYTTLPLSQARAAKESLKKKQQEKEAEKDSKVDLGDESSPMTSPIGGDKRKRKRSFSTENEAPPPPPPAPIVPGVTQASSLLNFHHSSSVRQMPTTNQTPMKISVSGSITRGSTPPITTPITQKRSINIPILKSSQGSLGALSSNEGFGQNQTSTNLLKSLVPPPAVSASILGGGGSSLVSKIRPRFNSMTSSILSQGSSSLPGLPPRPPRQRSNSLILHADGGHSFSSMAAKKDGIISRATSGPSILPDSSSGGPLNFLGNSNLQHLRGGGGIGPSKPGIQVRPDANKVSGASNSMSGVLGNRMLGRPTPQGVYMVSTNSGGTITVVTRTVASAGSVVTPRVVTVNTVSNARTSIMRGPAPATVVSMGKPNPIRQTTSVRPVIGGPKSNVIVVHKGAIPNAPRQIHQMRPRELSAKIFTKPLLSQVGGSSGAKLPSGLLTGTLVVKPAPVVGKSVAMTSNKEELHSPGTETASPSPTNLLVLDFNHHKVTPAVGSAPLIGAVVQGPSPPIPSGAPTPPIATKAEEANIEEPVVATSNFQMKDCNASTSACVVGESCTSAAAEAKISVVESSSPEETLKRAASDEDDEILPRTKKRSVTSLNETDEDNEWLKLGLELDEEQISEEEAKKEAIKVAPPQKTEDEASTPAPKEGEMQMMVEKVVEALNEGDSSEARTLLHQAGLELIDPSSAEDNYAISSLPQMTEGPPVSGVPVLKSSDVPEKTSVKTSSKEPDSSSDKPEESAIGKNEN